MANPNKFNAKVHISTISKCCQAFVQTFYFSLFFPEFTLEVNI